MGASLIQPLINLGYGLAAQQLGASVTQYRPVSATAPLANPVGAMTAAFSPDPQFQFKKPSQYGKAEWYAMLDPTNLAVGDYLVGAAQTFFVASIESLAPTMVVLTNITLNVLRQPAQTGVGTLGYGGDIGASEQVIMTGWPASMLETKRSQGGSTQLPGDVNLPWEEVLMPSLSGVPILLNDILVDTLNRRYRVSGAELTARGWRLHVIMTTT